MGASSIGVCLAFAGLRPRATVRRSRISDVLVFTKCYKMLIKILGIFYSREGGARKRSCTPPVGGLRVSRNRFFSVTFVARGEGNSEACEGTP